MYNKKNMYSECNKCSPNINSNKATSGCCIPGIKSTLRAIQDCIALTANIPGFGIPVIITLSNGVEYALNIITGTLNTLDIHNNIIEYNGIQISLCDIAKIEILTSQINNPEFVNCLTNKLIQITRHNHPINPCDYMAMSIDDDCDKCKNKSNNYYKKRNSCQCNSDCNCNKCSTCNKEEYSCGKDECSCKKELSCQLSNNKQQVESISYNGANASVGTVGSIDDISTISVINSANVNTSSDTFLNSISLQVNTTTIINNINLETSTVVNSITTAPTTIVTDIVSTNTTVLSNIQTTPVSVVSTLSLQPSTIVVSSITQSTIPVSGPIEITPQSVVSSITSNPATIVTDISGNLATVVTSYTPTAVSFVSGITDISSVSTTDQNIATFASNFASGNLQIIIPANALGTGVPVTDVTIPVSIGTATVGAISVSTLSLFTSPVTVANIVGTPTITPAITDLGTPTSIPVIASISSTSISTNLVDTISTAIISSITNAPTTIALSSVSTSVATVTGVNSVTESSINNLTSTSIVSAVSAITPSTISSLTVEQINSSTISSISSYDTAQAVTQVIPNITSSSALTNATLNTNQTNVVSNIEITDITILSPATELINGTILAIGYGIMVVRNTNGNISVYSLCEINSFTTTS